MSEPHEDRSPPPYRRNGWDGKLRVEKSAVLTNPEVLSDPDHSDEDAPPVEQIAADEDLLEDYEIETDAVDLVHRGIKSIQSLGLDRFPQLERLCLRQNLITHIELPDSLRSTLVDLDFYDNLIAHLRGFDGLDKLKSLDLSFNKLKHIKNIAHLQELTDLYFVQNKISRIEGLEGLTKLRNLELAANRIREIENLESLAALEQLWLGQNKISELKNLASLSNLKILSIQSNRLMRLDGLSSLPNLEEFYASDNLISELTGLKANIALRTIDVSNNQIKELKGLTHLKQIEEVWASSNELSSFDEIEKELGDKPELKTVYFEGNPLQLNNAVNYRNKVRLCLPRVKQIDATFVQMPQAADGVSLT